jgi:hypothetical protein
MRRNVIARTFELTIKATMSRRQIFNGIHFDDGGMLFFDFIHKDVRVYAKVVFPTYLCHFYKKYSTAAISSGLCRIILPPCEKLRIPDIILHGPTINDILQNVKKTLDQEVLIDDSIFRVLDLYGEKTYYAGLEQISSYIWQLHLKTREDPFPFLGGSAEIHPYDTI